MGIITSIKRSSSKWSSTSNGWNGQ